MILDYKVYLLNIQFKKAKLSSSLNFGTEHENIRNYIATAISSGRVIIEKIRPISTKGVEVGNKIVSSFFSNQTGIYYIFLD